MNAKKEAQTQLNLIPEISQRWSPRAFGPKEVSNEDLETLFEAARWAASSGNLQPWRFLVAKKGTPAFQKVLKGMASGNVSWAQHAPVLVVTMAQKTRVSSNGEKKPNPHGWHDLGLAMGNLSAQATNMKIHLHQMAGIQPRELENLFQVDTEFFEVVTAFALGYFDEESMEQLNEKQQQSERAARARKPLKELVFENSFAQSAKWLSNED